MTSRLLLLVAIGLLICTMGASCTSTGGSGDRYDDDRYDTDRNYDPRYDRDSGVPRTAGVAVKPRTGTLRYTPQEIGRVYVFDITARQLVYTLEIRAGQAFAASPDKDMIYVDEKEYRSVDLRKANTHALYFETIRAGSRPPEDRPGDNRPPPVGPNRPIDDRPPTPPSDRVPTVVPRDATLAASGDGEIGYRATRRGTVYVVDARDRLVFKMIISPRQTIRLHPRQNNATLDGQIVHTGVGSGVHRVYFGE